MASETVKREFWYSGCIYMHYRGASILPLYKDKGDKYECSNSIGISLFSVVGKLYGKVPR